MQGPAWRDAAHEEALRPQLRDAFPGDLHPAWIRACRRLSGAGYGDAVVDAYIRYSPEISRLVSPQMAIDVADLVSSLAIRSGRTAAALLPEQAIATVRILGEGQFPRWLRLIDYSSTSAPESVSLLLGQMSRLLEQAGLDGLESWMRIGIRATEGDPQRRLRFFKLEDSSAIRWLQRTSGQIGFADMEPRLRPFLTALWGDTPPLRDTPANAPEQARRRAGFDGNVVRLPSSFPGFQPADSEQLYRAAVAHIGAHLRFTRERFPVGGLKPAQIALVSLIEDARVEQLAMQELPGLARLFLPFYTATTAATAPALFARLARALADPAFEDSNPWVAKGRDAFFASRDDWHDQQLSRRIGNLLGNDLGQMRVQFDARNYVVQPAYRDDNLGLWDFGDDDQQAEDAEQVLSTARIRQEKNDNRPDRVESESRPDGDAGWIEVEEVPLDGVLVARYPEFDYVTGREQPDWTSVKEYQANASRDAERIIRLREQRADLANRLTALIRSARVSRAERLRRQSEGEFLDIDACIDAAIARRIGEPPSPRIHGSYERRSRDLSVLLLLDVSQSTSERVRDGKQTVLEVECQAAALLSQAMSGLGDPFAIAAFCSDRREDVRYVRIKDFSRPYDSLIEARLAGLQSSFSTRLGAAIRHAGAALAGQRSYRRLLLVVTDGEPSDIDVDDHRYLVEDARKAVQNANRQGINTFCVGLDSSAEAPLDRIFGRRNAFSIATVERLTVLLPRLYLMLGR